MIIHYINKNIKQYNAEDKIDVTVVAYEISEDDMIKLSQEQSMTYQPLQLGLHHEQDLEYSLIDLVVDDIENGRIIEGGLTSEGKFILNQYIVHKGLNEFLKMKQLGGSDDI